MPLRSGALCRSAVRLSEAIVGARSNEAEARMMAHKIIPLRPASNQTSALTHFDSLAVELLADGRAATLTAARIDAVLKQTCEDRSKLAAVLEDLEARLPTGTAQIDELNADLRARFIDGITHIDLLIQAIEKWRPGN